MFKNMKLGAKIGFGFGLLILIACLLGGLAIFNMKRVETESNKLTYEYVPEVKLATELERNSLLTMYAMRGYSLSESEKYLSEGRKQLGEVDKSLDECQELADKSEHLVKLKEEVGKCRESLQAYSKLADETVECNQEIANYREVLDANAAICVNSCAKFLDNQNASLAKEIDEGMGQAGLTERHRKITLINEIGNLINFTRIACFKSQAMRDPSVMKDALSNFAGIEEKFDEIREITRKSEDIQAIKDTLKATHEYKAAMEGLLANNVKIQQLNIDRGAAADAVLAGAQKTSKAGMEQTENIANTAAAALSFSSLVMTVGLLVALIVGVVLAFVITVSITKPINRIIAGLTEGSEQVSSAAGQVSSASQSLAEGATEQAAGLEETSSSLEEMASMTKQNADNAQQAKALASDTNRVAKEGAEAMNQMNVAINDIQKSSDETAKIIKVIDEIAFQTNLLALNAAVEAARAGEAGKGFAVVAEEVRNLAMRSAEAAKNTSSLIEESVKNSQNGVDIVGEVAKKLDEIGGAAGKVDELIAEIAAASNEQSQGIDQVNTAIAQMDKVTQSNAANAEESASASEELSAQAEQMNGIVGELVNLVGGSASNSTTAPRAVKHSDSTFHQIANSKSKVSDAENEIPFNVGAGSDDFARFNA